MTLAVALLCAGAVSGCNDAGGDDPPDRLAAAARTPPPLPPAPTPGRTAAARWTGVDLANVTPTPQGFLIAPDGREIRNWGDPRIRRYTAALLARIQYDFLTGDMAGVCKHIDAGASSWGGGFDASATCRRDMRAFARKLKRREFKPTPLRLLWVRTYPGRSPTSGIWVEDARGKRFRALFTYQDGEWRLQFGQLLPPEAIAMPLTG